MSPVSSVTIGHFIFFQIFKFPITALREIKILSCMSHPNIVRLEEIVTSSDTNSQNGESRSVPSSIYMVFEYCEGDILDVLKAVREGRFQLTRDHVCSFTRQLLEGMLYIHSNRVVHRDIKAANILVTRNCRLKIADWGLARSWRPPTEPAEATADEDVGANVHYAVASARKSEKEKGSRYSDNVVTLWYRAPELLMGVSSYTTAIDIWSIGCLVAELFLLRTLFQGRDELEQMHLIFRSCGTPAPKSWMRAPASRPATQTTALSSSHRPPLPARPRRLKEELAGTSGGPEGADLVDKLLALDPSCRLTAIQALDHEFLWQDEPKDPEKLPPLVPLRRMVPTVGGKG
jgi:serine/threonine protein kinase